MPNAVTVFHIPLFRRFDVMKIRSLADLKKFYCFLATYPEIPATRSQIQGICGYSNY